MYAYEIITLHTKKLYDLYMCHSTVTIIKLAMLLLGKHVCNLNIKTGIELHSAQNAMCHCSLPLSFIQCVHYIYETGFSRTSAKHHTLASQIRASRLGLTRSENGWLKSILIMP